jgi:hypothetical protein
MMTDVEVNLKMEAKRSFKALATTYKNTQQQN